MEDQSKEDQIRAKQAISPAGLADQSGDAKGGVGSELPDEEIPEVPITEIEENYLDENDNLDGVRQTHPNRNTDKPDLDKPAYGGGH
ncbi:hypothetical protein [Tellurirhabdus bombi]|uniref:hypothetical protein n=1 Tax=Tellurirhabdus bombi TaxID=2907205 RepID=UPI001F15731C|nr:hypothetical protein [Tellurirhabdus bombi]